MVEKSSNPEQQKGIPHTITICPNDDHQYQNDVLRLQCVTNDVRELLYNHLGHSYPYELHTEVSYPQQSQEGKIARIHYHGIIYLTPLLKATLFVEKLHKINKWARIEIDTIKDITKWQLYISKNKDAMEAYCEANKVPYILHHQMLPTDKVINRKKRRTKHTDGELLDKFFKP